MRPKLTSLFKIAFFVSHLLFFTNCLDLDICNGCQDEAPKVELRILDSVTKVDMLTTGRYSRDSIAVYYTNQGVHTNISLSFRYDTASAGTIITSYEWCDRSLHGIKSFYLKLNSKDQDTVVLDMVKRRGCCAGYNFRRFSINKIKIDFDTTSAIYLK